MTNLEWLRFIAFFILAWLTAGFVGYQLAIFLSFKHKGNPISLKKALVLGYLIFICMAIVIFYYAFNSQDE